MNALEIKQQHILAAQAIIPGNTNFLMLNLLRYRPQAAYGAGENFEPCTGREAYFKRYIPVFLELAAAHKEIKPFWIGKALAGLVLNENETWDNVALIAYPNFQSFRDIVESETYIKKALPHRLAALEDWKLVVTVDADPV